MNVAIVAFCPNQAVAEVATLAALDTRPVAILHVDVVDIAAVVKAIENHGILALLADDVSEVDIAHNRIVSAFGNLLRVVVQVDAKHGFTTTSHIDIANIDILDDATTCRRGLDANHAIEVGRIHFAVLHPKVLVAAGNLRTDNHAAMTVGHSAASNNHIL